MIRKLTGLFAKLIDKSEEIITREDEILDELLTDTEIITLSDTTPTFEEFSAPYYWDSGIRFDEFYWE